MARYKDYDYNQSKFIPVVFSEQIIPGTFEYTVHYLVDNELDLSVFDERYKNDDTGRLAYDPAILIKIILTAYSRGVTSSRRIERLCRENVLFMALSADSQPHFTTIAAFISRMDEVIQKLFLEILMVCGDQNLIGSDMFAIDGCKMPSNASKDWSGTHDDFNKKKKKIDRAVRRMLKKHREEDELKASDVGRRANEEKQIETLRAASRKIKKHLKESSEKIGSRGKPLKGNITDNESAKMKTSHGVLQGYNGVAAVDNENQIVVAAEAFGQGPENDLLAPLIEQVEGNLGSRYINSVKVTADAGFHNKGNVAYCQDNDIDAYLADGNYRKRDPKFKDYDRFNTRIKKKNYYTPEDFHYDKEAETCHCPAGKLMWRSGTIVRQDSLYVRFVGYLKDCRVCPLKKQCMRRPVKLAGRQVIIKLQEMKRKTPRLLDQMREKIDSDQGRFIYSQRLGTVEPVFGNINTTKKLNRFSLRGKSKVNAQWLMYCMVHNIEKIQRYGSIA